MGLPPASMSVDMDEGDRVRMDLVSRDPEIKLFHQAVPARVCARLVALARPEIAPAQVMDAAGKAAKVGERRRSESAFFMPGHDATIELVALACRISGRPKSHVEPVQVVRYLEGGFYGEHHDGFRMNGTVAYDRTGGQRVYSLVAYLQAPAAGGRTLFRGLGLGFEPISGNVITWGNLGPDGQLDARVLHESAPVERGEKWAAVAWVRERAWVSEPAEVMRNLL